MSRLQETISLWPPQQEKIFGISKTGLPMSKINRGRSLLVSPFSHNTVSIMKCFLRFLEHKGQCNFRKPSLNKIENLFNGSHKMYDNLSLNRMDFSEHTPHLIWQFWSILYSGITSLQNKLSWERCFLPFSLVFSGQLRYLRLRVFTARTSSVGLTPSRSWWRSFLISSTTAETETLLRYSQC